MSEVGVVGSLVLDKQPALPPASSSESGAARSPGSCPFIGSAHFLLTTSLGGACHYPTPTRLTNESWSAPDMPDFSTESPTSREKRDSSLPYIFQIRKQDLRDEVIGEPGFRAAPISIHKGTGRGDREVKAPRLKPL